MEIIDVPEVEPYDENIPSEHIEFSLADIVLTRLMKHESALIHAEYRLDNPSTTWFIRPQPNHANAESDEPIAVSNSRWEFRNTLARFGHHYANNQLYGGFSRCLLRQNGKTYKCSIYMSNEGLSGFWIRIYGVLRNSEV